MEAWTSWTAVTFPGHADIYRQLKSFLWEVTSIQISPSSQLLLQVQMMRDLRRLDLKKGDVLSFGSLCEWPQRRILLQYGNTG